MTNIALTCCIYATELLKPIIMNQMKKTNDTEIIKDKVVIWIKSIDWKYSDLCTNLEFECYVSAHCKVLRETSNIDEFDWCFNGCFCCLRRNTKVCTKLIVV